MSEDTDGLPTIGTQRPGGFRAREAWTGATDAAAALALQDDKFCNKILHYYSFQRTNKSELTQTSQVAVGMQAPPSQAAGGGPHSTARARWRLAPTKAMRGAQ